MSDSATRQQADAEVTPASELWRGVAASLPINLGVAPMALVLGAQAAQKGLTLAEVPLMTGLNFAGGSEFAAVKLWTSPPHLLLIVAMTFLVNSRHLLMGAALAPFIQHLPKRKAFPAVFLVLLKGMWHGARAARPWLVSLVIAALTSLLLPGAWYVPAGAVSGIVAAFFWVEQR